METPNMGAGLYQVGLIIAPTKASKKTSEHYFEGLASNPLEAYQKAENALYIETGKQWVIRENIITLVIPNNSYFDPD